MKRLEPLAHRGVAITPPPANSSSTAAAASAHHSQQPADSRSPASGAPSPKEDALVAAMLSRSRGGGDGSPTSPRANQSFHQARDAQVSRASGSLATSQQHEHQQQAARRNNPYQRSMTPSAMGSPSAGLAPGHPLGNSDYALSRSGDTHHQHVQPPASFRLRGEGSHGSSPLPAPRHTLVTDANELDEMQSEGDEDDDYDGENNNNGGGDSSPLAAPSRWARHEVPKPQPRQEQQQQDDLLGSSVFDMVPPDDDDDAVDVPVSMQHVDNTARSPVQQQQQPTRSGGAKTAAPAPPPQPASHQHHHPPQHLQRHGGRGWDALPVTAKDLEGLVASTRKDRGGNAAGANAAAGVDVPCPPGFTFTVYSENVSQHYHIPSEDVRITQGAIKYVDHHARFGPQTRFRFQLCHNFLTRKCPRRSECSYIHAARLPPATEVHLNPYVSWRPTQRNNKRGDGPTKRPQDDVAGSFQDDPAVAEGYETLPPGTVLVVHAPNAGAKEAPTSSAMRAEHAGSIPSTTKQVQYIPSHLIIYTLGGEAALRYLREQQQGAAPATQPQGDGHSAPAPGKNPRHCAHYQFKRVCNLGRQCLFIHSKVPFAEGGFTSPDSAVDAPHTAAPPPPQQHQQHQQQPQHLAQYFDPTHMSHLHHQHQHQHYAAPPASQPLYPLAPWFHHQHAAYTQQPAHHHHHHQVAWSAPAPFAPPVGHHHQLPSASSSFPSMTTLSAGSPYGSSSPPTSVAASHSSRGRAGPPSGGGVAGGRAGRPHSRGRSGARSETSS